MSDKAAIAELHRVFALQKGGHFAGASRFPHLTLSWTSAAFLKDQYPSVASRQADLHKIAGMVRDFLRYLTGSDRGDTAPTTLADDVEPREHSPGLQV